MSRNVTCSTSTKLDAAINRSSLVAAAVNKMHERRAGVAIEMAGRLAIVPTKAGRVGANTIELCVVEFWSHAANAASDPIARMLRIGPFVIPFLQ